VINEDILDTFNLNVQATIYLKKLIYLVANSMPFKPNIESLGSSLKISKETVYNYLEYLTQGKLFISLKAQNKGLDSVRKADKIYLSNSNLYCALIQSWEIGTIREAFFVSQIQSFEKLEIFTDKKVDFRINNDLFEIGGENKLNQKSKYPQNTYFVIDSVEFGSKKVVPLWLVGFLN